jgi:catechol 2,3-dioxygenase-like lactoylglutathione lyase family enzyme
VAESDRTLVHFESSTPIFRVQDMQASLRFYVELLGFRNAPWCSDDFAYLRRDGAGLYLSRQSQGRGAAWAWIGVEDVELLHEEYKQRGVPIRMAPANFPWALEMHVEDPDGNVIRFGSDPKAGEYEIPNF